MAKSNQHVLLTADRALRVVKVDDIGVDPSYQREIKTKHKKIVAEYDEDAFGIPVVGQREDASLWIVDGLQRLTAKKKMGAKTMRVEVFASRGSEHEAEVFSKINKNRVNLSSADLFWADITAGHPDALLIQKIVADEGFVIRKGGGSSKSTTTEHASKVLTCYGTMMTIVTRYGGGAPEGFGDRGALLKTVLSILKKCWPDDAQRTKPDIIDGLAIWLIRYKGTADAERLVDRLNTKTPAQIMYSSGLGVGNRGNNVADEIEKLYRKRMKKS